MRRIIFSVMSMAITRSLEARKKIVQNRIKHLKARAARNFAQNRFLRKPPGKKEQDLLDAISQSANTLDAIEEEEEEDRRRKSRVPRVSRRMKGAIRTAVTLAMAARGTLGGGIVRQRLAATQNPTYRGGGLSQLPVASMTPNASRSLAMFDGGYRRLANEHTRSMGDQLRVELNAPAHSRNQAAINSLYARLKRGPNAKTVLRKHLRDFQLHDEWERVSDLFGGDDGVAPQHVFDAFLAHKIPNLPEYGVFAHGAMLPPEKRRAFFTVPKDTAVVYITLPTLFGMGGKLQRNRKQMIENARRGSATSGGGYLVMYTEGEIAPENILDYGDHNGAFGGLTGVFDAKSGNRAKNTQSPRASQRTSVASLVYDQGPGVYYVVSCRDLDIKHAQTYATHEMKAREKQRKHTKEDFDTSAAVLQEMYEYTILEILARKIPVRSAAALPKLVAGMIKKSLVSTKADMGVNSKMIRKVPDSLLNTMAYLAIAGHMVGLVGADRMTVLKGGTVSRLLDMYSLASMAAIGNPGSMVLSVSHGTAVGLLYWSSLALRTAITAAKVLRIVKKPANMVTNWFARKKAAQLVDLKAQRISDAEAVKFLKTYGLRPGMSKWQIDSWWWKQVWDPGFQVRKAHNLALRYAK